MNLIDNQGHCVSGATAESLHAWEQAAHELRCMVDDPVASVDRALALAPEMTMAHVLRAWLHLLGTEPGGIATARAACDAARALPADDRERRHVEAAAAVAGGRWREGGRRLEDLSLRYPLDTLALQAGHQIDFFRGDSRMLRDRIARALPAWDAGVPGRHAVLGMHAFGLEETGDYAQAAEKGRQAVALEPRDSWAWHAVAHVHEMLDQPREGVAWLQPSVATWSTGSFLAPHNAWHLALFHLEQGDATEALRLYDTAIGGTGSSVVLDLVDASALLWRLHLLGVDVGERWISVADRWQPMAGAGQYAFNDVHATLAFTLTDRVAAQQAVRDAQARAMAEDGDNATFTRAVGAAVTRAIECFGRGDFATSTALLRDVRHHAHRFGGSHAQRDLVDLTLIEAALRGGDAPLARGLAAERLARRPRSASAQRLVQRARALHAPA
jgi:tetratricopeptide (TPR) repeat protein